MTNVVLALVFATLIATVAGVGSSRGRLVEASGGCGAVGPGGRINAPAAG